jgi:hypothetical protein
MLYGDSEEVWGVTCSTQPNKSPTAKKARSHAQEENRNVSNSLQPVSSIDI